MGGNGLSVVRMVLWGAVAFAAVFAVVVFSQRGGAPAPQTASYPSGTAAIGGPIALIDQDGAPATEARFKGKPTVIYFGFAHCPDVCPAALGKLSAALDIMGDEAAALNPVFITVDPERDTPEKLKSYLSFDPRFTSLTGSQDEVDAVLDAFRVYRAKVELKDSALEYTMDHVSLYYVMDGEWRFETPIRDTLTPEEIANELKKFI